MLIVQSIQCHMEYDCTGRTTDVAVQLEDFVQLTWTNQEVTHVTTGRVTHVTTGRVTHDTLVQVPCGHTVR
jgi:hypothetical protein